MCSSSRIGLYRLHLLSQINAAQSAVYFQLAAFRQHQQPVSFCKICPRSAHSWGRQLSSSLVCHNRFGSAVQQFFCRFAVRSSDARQKQSSSIKAIPSLAKSVSNVVGLTIRFNQQFMVKRQNKRQDKINTFHTFPTLNSTLPTSYCFIHSLVADGYS